jgi:hypothetical protein
VVRRAGNGELSLRPRVFRSRDVVVSSQVGSRRPGGRLRTQHREIHPRRPVPLRSRAAPGSERTSMGSVGSATRSEREAVHLLQAAHRSVPVATRRAKVPRHHLRIPPRSEGSSLGSVRSGLRSARDAIHRFQAALRSGGSAVHSERGSMSRVGSRLRSEREAVHRFQITTRKR